MVIFFSVHVGNLGCKPNQSLMAANLASGTPVPIEPKKFAENCLFNICYLPKLISPMNTPCFLRMAKISKKFMRNSWNLPISLYRTHFFLGGRRNTPALLRNLSFPLTKIESILMWKMKTKLERVLMTWIWIWIETTFLDLYSN